MGLLTNLINDQAATAARLVTHEEERLDHTRELVNLLERADDLGGGVVTTSNAVNAGVRGTSSSRSAGGGPRRGSDDGPAGPDSPFRDRAAPSGVGTSLTNQQLGATTRQGFPQTSGDN